MFRLELDSQPHLRLCKDYFFLTMYKNKLEKNKYLAPSHAQLWSQKARMCARSQSPVK